MPNAKLHLHRLDGCCPTPLAHYLKALGILRLVAEQKDPNVRGWWKHDRFHLATVLSKDELERYFLDEYSPTPLVAPWNGGSGFYPKDNQSGIAPIESSTAERFHNYRETIRTARNSVSHLDGKPDKGSEKNNVIATCRREFLGGASAWIEAAIAIDGNGDCSFPAMLGTGGNDGRLDFTTNFMQRIVSLFDVRSSMGSANPETVSQLHTAFWATANAQLESGAIGQFFPGAAGGPNGSTGFTGSVRVNPWDYVLMLEGAILFRSGLSRRCANESLPQAAAPFAVRSSGAGYGTSDTTDQGPRGEQWVPLWIRPALMTEITSIFREGKTQIDGKTAQRGIDLARSVARMGTARGIHQFERYGYIERNGLANLAVPLGRFDVANRPNQDLLSEVTPWIEHFRRIADDKNAPESFRRCQRSIENAVFVCTQNPEAQSFLELLVTMAAAEEQFLNSQKFAAEKNARPIPRLQSGWLELIDPMIGECPSDIEFRLARALAFQSARDEKGYCTHFIRHHWLPIKNDRFDKGENGLRTTPEQCAVRLDLESASIAIIKRRLLNRSYSKVTRLLPLQLSHKRFGASLDDIQAFLEHRVDEGRILSIARGLMAIETRPESNSESNEFAEQSPQSGLAPFGLMRLAMLPDSFWIPGVGDVTVKCDRTMYMRLAAGDLPAASQIAIRQLSNAQLRPRVMTATGSAQYARRLAASLVFGLSPRMYERLARQMTTPVVPTRDSQESSITPS